MRKYALKQPKDDLIEIEASKILNKLLEEIEQQAFRTRYQSGGAFNSGWQNAYRSMFSKYYKTLLFTELDELISELDSGESTNGKNKKMRKYALKQPKDDLIEVEASKILNRLLEEIEQQAFRTRYQSDGAFNSGWQSAYRSMFWFVVDKGIKPVTYNGQLIFESIVKPTKEREKEINDAIKKAEAERII